MAKKKVNRKPIVYVLLSLLIFAVLLTNIFYDRMEILLYVKPDIDYSSHSQVHFIDVGQGDCIAINLSNGKTMLVDTGTKAYEDKLLRYLDNIVLKDTKKIDYLVLTHLDSDHSGNILSIIDMFEIGTFYRPYVYERSEGGVPVINADDNDLYLEILTKLKHQGAEIEFSLNTIDIVDGDISIKWLYPYASITDYSDSNSMSPVIIIEDNNLKLMLTGDIDSEVEDYIINKYESEIVDIDILKLAHHGSKYSTSAEFLSATTPKYAIISVGKNSYGHPSSDVLGRIMEYDENTSSNLYENTLTTIDKGNIILTFDNSEPQFIENIDSYSFIGYWVYEIVAIIVILIIMFLPNYKVFKINRRFKKQNEKYVKNKLKEKKSK